MNKSNAAHMQVNHNLSLKISYDQADVPVYIRSGDLSSYPNGRTMLHWHDDMEIILVNSGSMNCTIDSQTITIHENDGIIINSRQFHYSTCNPNQDCSYTCMLLHPSLLNSNDFIFHNLILPIIENDSFHYIYLDRKSAWKSEILRILSLMIQQKNTNTHHLQIISNFAQIMILLYDHTVMDTNSNPDNLDLIIMQNMIGYIQHNFDKHITLADIAKAGGIGQSKCCQLFASQLNSSPINYLNQYRLDRSAKLLRETSTPIIEIALATGFSDSSYFAKQFKQWANVSPTQYRKDHFGSVSYH